MKQSAVLAIFGPAIMAAAHGIVSDIKIDGTFYGGYNPFGDKYMNPVPERIVWAFPDAGNGPVEDVSSPAITCNKGATAAPISAPAAAGSEVTFFWTTWPESHRGPVMTYMADCGGDCSSADATKLSYFKIDHAGYEGGKWASDTVIANNNSWTVTIPSDIAAGNYIIRHELLALHSAGQENGAQFYPMCGNLKVTGSGSAKPEGVKFPGAYKKDDAGILVNIYSGLTSYTIPGPAVYGSGSGSGGSAPASSAAASAPASSAAASAPAASAPAASAPAASAPAASAPAASAPAASAPAASAPATSAAAPATSAVAKPTSAPAAPVVSSAPVAAPSTLATVTRKPSAAPAAPSSGSGTGSGSGTKTPESINKCLDEVNACIAKAQSKTGGAADFSACDAKRASCY